MAQKQQSLPSNDYIFKGVTDCVLYMIVYFLMPVGSIFLGLIKQSPDFFFTAFSLCVSLVYDYYSRYKGEKGRKLDDWVLILGGVYVVLACYFFFLIQFFYSNAINSILWYIPTLFLFLAPSNALRELLVMRKNDKLIANTVK